MSDYDASSIRVLSGLEHVRVRPAMYIGSTNVSGLNHLLSEIIDNSVDEYGQGYGTKIYVSLNDDGSCTVRDFGRGIPVDVDLEQGIPAVRLVLTTLNAGGKFDNDSYLYSSGLHGVGSSVVNALSEWMDVEVYRDGNVYHDRYEYGKPVIELEDGMLPVIGTSKETGTKITFKPDASIFSTVVFKSSDIKNRIHQTAYLNPNLEFIFEDKRSGSEETISFHEPNGIKAYVDELSQDVAELCECYTFNATQESEKGAVQVYVAFKYVQSLKETVVGFCNNIQTHEGGTHLTGFKSSLTSLINSYARQLGSLKANDDNFTGADVRSGLIAVVSIQHPHPQFEGQTKTKLDNPEVAKIVSSVCTEQLTLYFDRNVDVLKKVISVALRCRKLRKAEASAHKNFFAKRKKYSFDSNGKLAGCESKDASANELFICLVGSTEIRLLDGTIQTIEDLYKCDKNSFWIYSCNHEGEFVPAKAQNVRITSYVKDTIRLHLSDGSYVECTPSHRFLDRNTMSWVTADSLTVGQSLYHLSFSENGKYESVYNPYKRQYEDVHRVVNSVIDYNNTYKEETETYLITHHIDGNTANNTPENLMFLDRNDHFRKNPYVNRESQIKRFTEYAKSKQGRENSSKHLTQYNKSQKHREASKRAWADPEKRRRMSQGVQSEEGRKAISKAVKQAHKDGRYKNGPYKNNRNRIAQTIRHLIDNNIEFNELNYNENRQYTNVPMFNKILKYFCTYEEAYEYGKNYNYKVIDVEHIHYDTDIPVYCLTVDNQFHSYALANGLITHNCEGDSAAGSSKMARDRKHQAILPIRGKILNVEKCTVNKALANEEIKTIIYALGCGFGEGYGNDFDISKLKYDKIIIMTDADSDGRHITTLLMTLFYRLMPEIVRQGHLYCAVPPLYKAFPVKGTPEYIYTDSELNSYLNENKVSHVQRYKGLGEMNPDQLWETTMNPKTRLLRRVVIDDDASDSRITEQLMGTDVKYRKEFIRDNAQTAEIDV